MKNKGETSVEEFNQFLNLIPDSFDPYFIQIWENGKSPKTIKDDSWKDDEYRINENEAQVRIKQDKNVGFVARGYIVVLDIDDEDEAREILDDELWKTLRVSTRSGGTHLYFVNGGVGNADVPKVVEVRAEWRYVLAPGSYVDPKNTGGNGLYEVESAKPPVLLFPDDLPRELLYSGNGGRSEPPILEEPNEPVKNVHGWTLKEIREEDEKLDALLSTLNPEDYPSISEADFAACVKLLYWEFEPGQVKDILRGYRARSKVIDRPDYVDRTVKNAGSRVNKTISDAVSETWRPGNIFDEIQLGGNHS